MKKSVTEPSPDGLASLPNLGPWSAQLLAQAGIRTVAQLRELGAVAAFARVRRLDAKASLNLLWALEAALSGLPWQVVAREHRTSLLLALEQLERGPDAAWRPADGKPSRPAAGRGRGLA